ncbi:MAG TPA: hypothetical protein VIJ93_06510 [bacterium]
MNAFANPEDATLYEFPEFPAPPRKVISFPVPEGGQTGNFVDFEHSQSQPQEESTTVVQTAIFQDFKEVLAPAQS